MPLDRAGRVAAEATLRVPGRPEIFVVGDICSFQQDGKPLPVVPTHEEMHLDYRDPYARGGAPIGGN